MTHKRRDDIISFISRRGVTNVSVALLLMSGISQYSLVSEVKDLESQIVTVKESNKSLSNEIANLIEEIYQLDQEISSLNSDKAVLQAEKKEMTEDIANYETKVSDLNEQIKALENKVQNLIKEKQVLEESRASVETKIDTSSTISLKEAGKEEAKSNNTEVSNSSEWKSMTVNASAYTMVEHGDVLGGTGLTSTGTVPTAHRTIAVDPRVIPYGSKIQYNGVTYTAEDTGGMIKGNKVDIYMDTLNEAVTFGRKDITIKVQFPK